MANLITYWGGFTDLMRCAEASRTDGNKKNAPGPPTAAITVTAVRTTTKVASGIQGGGRRPSADSGSKATTGTVAPEHGPVKTGHHHSTPWSPTLNRIFPRVNVSDGGRPDGPYACDILRQQEII
jgi:hypothetical protein